MKRPHAVKNTVGKEETPLICWSLHNLLTFHIRSRPPKDSKHPFIMSGVTVTVGISLGNCLQCLKSTNTPKNCLDAARSLSMSQWTMSVCDLWKSENSSSKTLKRRSASLDFSQLFQRVGSRNADGGRAAKGPRPFNVFRPGRREPMPRSRMRFHSTVSRRPDQPARPRTSCLTENYC